MVSRLGIQSPSNAGLLNAEARAWSDACQNPPDAYGIDYMRLGFRPPNVFLVDPKRALDVFQHGGVSGRGNKLRP